MRRYAYYPVTTQGQYWQGIGVVAAPDGKSGPAALNDMRNLLQVTAGFLYADDVVYLAQPDSGFRVQVDYGS